MIKFHSIIIVFYFLIPKISGQEFLLGITGSYEFAKLELDDYDYYFEYDYLNCNQDKIDIPSIGLSYRVGTPYGLNFINTNSIGIAKYDLSGSYQTSSYWNHGYNRYYDVREFIYKSTYTLYNGDFLTSIPLAKQNLKIPVFLKVGLNFLIALKRNVKENKVNGYTYSTYNDYYANIHYTSDTTNYSSPDGVDFFNSEFSNLQFANIGLEYRWITNKKINLYLSFTNKIFLNFENRPSNKRFFDSPNLLDLRKFYSVSVGIYYNTKRSKNTSPT